MEFDHEPPVPMRILVAEDETRIANLVEAGLRGRGFDVVLARDGAEALAKACGGEFDCIVLDLMLPKIDGIEVLRQIRARGVCAMVLILTARGEVPDRVVGLEAGADDYMGKPFSLDELAARLRALGRRRNNETTHICVVSDLTVNLLTREVTRAGQSISLTPREFALLECFLRSAGRTISRVQLIRSAWNYHFDPQTNLVDVYIKRLRDKLKDDGSLIVSVRGVGYRLTPP